MLVGQLTEWPPVVQNGHVIPDRSSGIFLGCQYISKSVLHPAHLLVTIRLDDMDHTAVYWHPSEAILARIAATLRNCAGIPIVQVNELELM